MDRYILERRDTEGKLMPYDYKLERAMPRRNSKSGYWNADSICRLWLLHNPTAEDTLTWLEIIPWFQEHKGWTFREVTW